MADPNWEAIETEYVTSAEGISYKVLAAKYGLNRATVGKHGTAGEWRAKREAHRRRKAEKALTKVEEKLAKRDAADTINALDEVDASLRVLGEKIRSGALEANSLDAAVNAQVNALKFREVLGGNPDSRTEQSVSIRPLDPAEIKRLKELVYALDDGDGTGPGDGGGGSSGDGTE